MPVNFNERNLRIGIIGLGYVGLPLAVAFGKKCQTFGFDINTKRIKEINSGLDSTNELSADEIEEALHLSVTSDLNALACCNFYIVTVPTPIDGFKRPDLRPLQGASEQLGPLLAPDDIVVYESTVYPGLTEEICIPILESTSKLSHNVDFFCGYSPERINPGDRSRRLENIVKVVSACNEEILEVVAAVYSRIIDAGVYKAESIKVAEAAKVIENTQRDINIALMNELSCLFSKLDIDTHSVLRAAKTKWNFLDFKPGLVGGHCIGVDPYYLTHKALEIDYHPEMILAGRRINDSMSAVVCSEIIRLMITKGIQPFKSSLLVLGLAFKENCPDIRNSKVVDLVTELRKYGAEVDVYDPLVSYADVKSEFSILALSALPKKKYDGIVLAVPHEEFLCLSEEEIYELVKSNYIIYDLKGAWTFIQTDGGL